METLSGKMQPRAITYAHFGHLPAFDWCTFYQTWPNLYKKTCLHRLRVISSNDRSPNGSYRVRLALARETSVSMPGSSGTLPIYYAMPRFRDPVAVQFGFHVF